MVYFDSQSSTPVHPKIIQEIPKWLAEYIGNPHSPHQFGQNAMHQVDSVRETISKYFGVNFSEIIFTSGATESNNIVIQGVIKKALSTFNTIEVITTPFEHSSVSEPIKFLQHEYPGRITIVHAPLDKEGIVDVSELLSLLHENTALVSIIHAHNEIGVIQPLREIGRIIRNYKEQHPASQYPIFHSDGAQAVWSIAENLPYDGIDCYSISGHKMYAPKGIGALYIKKNTPIQPIMHGGGQEYGMRSGTLNTPLILALGKAFELITTPNHINTIAYVRELRDYLFCELQKTHPHILLNGSQINRLPQNLNIFFPSYPAEKLLIQLDLSGIAVSSGSACHSGAWQVSDALVSLYPEDPQRSHNSIRIGLHQFHTQSDCDEYVRIVNYILTQ